MSQSRRTIEKLLNHGSLPLANAHAAATHLEVYPSRRTWLAFFDRAALIIGAVALALSLVFFIAYNWQNLGTMGKFALVEGALVVTITLYVALSFRRRYTLIRQLLLLVASIITGSLLALFGQTYQTGADTWQLFFGWAALITPWVLIARFPALWLLWLGLVNAGLTLYLDVVDFSFTSYLYKGILQVGILAIVNFVALNLWLLFLENIHLTQKDISKPTSPTKVDLHWSTYVVGLVSALFITGSSIVTIFDEIEVLASVITFLLWMSWCVFMLWRFYKNGINLLMLTYLCGSVITVVIFWAGRLLLGNFDAGGFLVLALLLISMSSAAVVWLRKIAHLTNDNNVSHTVIKGDGYE